MNNGLSKPLGLLLLAAAVFAAAGCAGPGSPDTTSAASTSIPSPEFSTPGELGPSLEPAPATAETAEPTDAAAEKAAGATGSTDAATGTTAVPGPQAAPDPTFAPVERQYLASRVPKGTDPNAVLQVGQERCAQLEAVKAADPKAVVSQLIEKRDADVVEAVTRLCPALQPELDAAARGFTDGEYSIGDAAASNGTGSISSGTYEAWNPSPGCQLRAYDATGGLLAESSGTSPFTIPAGTTRVTSDSCYTWLAA